MTSESNSSSATGTLRWTDTLHLAAGIFLGLGAIRFVWVFGKPLAVLVLGITIAEALSPIVDWPKRYVSRTVAVVAVYGSFVALAVALAWLVVPSVTDQVRQFMTLVPDQIGRLTGQVNQWLSNVGGESSLQLRDFLSGLSGTLISVPMDIATTVLTTVLVIFLSLYWLLAKPAIARFAESLFPVEARPRMHRISADMGRAMGGYLRGVALNGLATGTLTWLALYFAGVHLSFVLGMITGVGEFFPYIGPILSAVPAILVALVQSPSKALVALLIYVAVQQIEGHLLTPNIMRSQTDIPRPLVIIAVFGGGVVGGLLGAMVAIPAAGAAKVLVEEVLAPAVRRRMAEQDWARTDQLIR